MKKYLYLIFLAFTLLGFSSCNSDEGKNDPDPNPHIENPKEDDLLGTWEIYFASKQVTGGGVQFPVFRTPDYDGFINKFYKKENGTYAFENLNLVNQIVDKGTYKIVDKKIVMDVTFHNGKDTVFQNIEEIGLFQEKKETLSVFKFFSIGDYNVKDNRSMRSLERAPKAHPSIEKLDVDAIYGKMVGTWEVYDYFFSVNAKYQEVVSKLELDSIRGNSYTFAYDNDGKKKVSLKLKGWDDDGNVFWDETSYTNLEIKIVDDIMYYIVPEYYNEETKTVGPQAFWLWITEWNEKGQGLGSFIDLNQFRTNSRPDYFYQEKKFLKKVK